MKDFPVIKFTLAFICGILLLPVFKISIFIVLTLFIILLLLINISKRKRFFEKLNIVVTLCLLILILSLGNITAQFNQKHFNPVVSGLYKENNVSASGTINNIELLREYEVLFLIDADKFIVKDLTINDQMAFLCKLRANDEDMQKFYNTMKPGCKIEVTGRYLKGREKRNPGEFDYNKYLMSKGVSGIIIIDTLINIRVVETSTSYIDNTVFQIRKFINSQINSLHSKETSSLLRGLILADRKEIDKETKTQFINSGVVHVLAVSGLHVGFIALIFMVLFGRFNLYLRSIFTIAGLLGFMFITGVPPSVFRATVMAVVIIAAFLTNRSTNIFNSLAIAALIILIMNPEEIYSPGFQLSFSAVIAIGIIYPMISRAISNLKIKSKIVRYVLLFIAVSLAAQIGTLPFTLIYFGKLSVIALIVNLAVIPIIGIIISLAVTTLFLSTILPSLASYYAAANDFVTNILLTIIEFAGELSYSHIRIPGYSIYDAIIFYLFLTIFLYFIGKFKSRIAGLVLLMFTVANISLFSFFDDKKLLPDNRLSVFMIDVGQGDAFLVKFPNNKTALIDAGEATYYFDNGERIIIPLLNYLGIDKIDYGFVSHIDLDHYGGFISLILNDKIGGIYKPSFDSLQNKDVRFEKFLKDQNIPVTYYDSQLIEVGNSRAYVLVDKETSDYYNLSSNNSSGIIKIVFGNSAFLFIGDAEMRAEKILTDGYQDFLNVNVLKVGHHGSKTSTSDEFIEMTSPKYALISAGIKNKFGHPDETVISKLETNDTEIFRTDLSGGLMLTSNGEEVFVTPWR
jgi:competence protein ComEC